MRGEAAAYLCPRCGDGRLVDGGSVAYTCGHFALTAPPAGAAGAPAVAPVLVAEVPPLTAADVRAVMAAHAVPPPVGARSAAETRRLREAQVRAAVTGVVDRVTAALRRELAEARAAAGR